MSSLLQQDAEIFDLFLQLFYPGIGPFPPSRLAMNSVDTFTPGSGTALALVGRRVLARKTPYLSQ